MSVRDQLLRLVELQAVEVDKRRLDAEIAALPGARAALEARVVAARAKVKAVEAKREASGKARRALEGDLKEAEARLDKYRDHELMVKTNEQLWALQGEMKGVQDKIGAFEEKILEEMERADRCVASIADAEAAVVTTEAEVAAAGRGIDARQATIEGAVAEAAARIAALRLDIEPGLLAIYERISTVRGGVGVSETIGGACSGCNVQLRPQVFLEVQRMEHALQCDSCKRILFNRDSLQLPAELQVAGD